MAKDSERNIKLSKHFHDLVGQKLGSTPRSAVYESAMREITEDPLWLATGNFYTLKKGDTKAAVEAYPVELNGKEPGIYADALGTTIGDMFMNALARHLRIDLAEYPDTYEKTTLVSDTKKLHELTPAENRLVIPGTMEALERLHPEGQDAQDINLRLKRGSRRFGEQLTREASSGRANER